MAIIDFNPIGVDSVIIKFVCPNCRLYIESEIIDVPEPNWLADKARDSQNYNNGYAYCEECGKDYNIEIVSGFDGGWIEIDDLDEEFADIEVKEIYDETEIDAILSNTEYFLTFKNEMNNLKELCSIRLEDANLNNIMKRQIYIGVITCLETYLSDAFINSVMANEESIRKFVHTFKDFEHEQLPLNQIFNYFDKIEKKTKKALLDIIYHNIPKVNGMYRDALGVEFPPFGNIQKFIQIRHDLIHRNGKTKDGGNIIIDDSSVGFLLYEIEAFVSCIDQVLNEKLNPE